MDVVLRLGGAPTVDQIKDPAPNVTSMEPNDVLGVGLSAVAYGGDNIALPVTDPTGASFPIPRLWVATTGACSTRTPATTSTSATARG
jgi:hypothetical protein